MSVPVPAEKLAEWVETVARVGYDTSEWERLPAMSRDALLDEADDALAAVLPDVLAYATAQADSDSMVEASVECPSCGASIRAHVRDGGAS